ncbi:phage antirepressor KilAC domain-containing protein, partial [uncultured Slackia sp.]|uniref:phage antirepressor KilAC domain-containing protein n=1 Tax=uncultured Slackia sp. TaxID=665903 RepID=UPI0026E02C1B
FRGRHLRGAVRGERMGGHMVLADNAGLMAFENAAFGTIRAGMNGGEPWFVAKDVCDALGVSNITETMARLDEDEFSITEVIDTIGRTQEVRIVTEPGFYKLVMRSRKPEAKQFQRWVTHEVLPAIRKTGGYLAAKPDETPEEIMARALLVANDTMARQRERIEGLTAENAELRPKALFADAVAASDGTCLVGELAKMLRQNGVDMGQNRLFGWLRDNGWLGKTGCNRNVPTQRAMEMGLFRIKETAVTHSDGHVTVTRTPKVTGKGQAYFVNKFIESEGEGRLFPCA